MEVFSPTVEELLLQAHGISKLATEAETLAAALKLYISQKTKGRPAAERFWEKVEKSDSCWTWTAAATQNGYGSFRTEMGRRTTAHRYSWELEHGPIPEGLHVLHRCDNRACVRPEHLWLGTHEENMQDMAQKGRAPGTGVGNPKFTRAQIEAIRSEYSIGGVTKADLARRYGMTSVNMGLILNRKTWV